MQILNERLVYITFNAMPVLMQNYFFTDLNIQFNNEVVTDIHVRPSYKTAGSEEHYAVIPGNPYVINVDDCANFTVTFVTKDNVMLLENYPLTALIQPDSSAQATGSYPAYRDRVFDLKNLDLGRSFVTPRQVSSFTIAPFCILFNFFTK